MLDRISISEAISAGLETRALIADSQTLKAWAERTQQELQRTIEVSQRVLRHARSTMVETRQLGSLRSSTGMGGR